MRDQAEAQSLLRARSESDLFLLLVQRRAAAFDDLRDVHETSSLLEHLHESAMPQHVEARQTFSSASPLVYRCLSAVQRQVAFLDGSLRESMVRLRALARELEQSAQVRGVAHATRPHSQCTCQLLPSPT